MGEFEGADVGEGVDGDPVGDSVSSTAVGTFVGAGVGAGDGATDGTGVVGELVGFGVIAAGKVPA